MAVLRINNVQVPDDFPSTEYEAVCSKTNDHSKTPAHPMLIGALNAVAYRFNAFAEYGEKLLASIHLHGPGPTHRQRYEQERDLFGFFSNGTSSLDGLAFAMFAVAAITGSPNFPLTTEKNERNVDWDALCSACAKAFPSDPVTPALKSIESDQGRKDFYRERSILTHRAAPPRAHRLRVGENRPNSTMITRLDLLFEPAAISSRRQQVATLLTNGFDAMEMFVTAHL